MNLIINAVDYLIMLKYFQGMLGKRKECPTLIFAGYGISVILVLSYINSMKVPLYNLISVILCIFLTGIWYESQNRIRFLLGLLYIGIGLIAEVVVYGALQKFDMVQKPQSVLTMAMLICEIIRVLMVAVLCIMKQEKNLEFPKGTTILMTVVFIIGIAGSVLLNIKNNGKVLNLTGVLMAVIMLGIIYSIMFLLIEKTNQSVRIQHEKELLLQEAKLKELYYKEIEKSGNEMMKIRHDFKNRLSTLYDMTEKDIENARSCIRRIYDDIAAQENCIFTLNKALNAICKIKFAEAEREGIEVSQCIRVSDNMNMDYGDMGILIGNLMDNAIEASRECQDKKMDVFIEWKAKKLVCVISNSKLESREGSINRTSKKNAKCHGYGLKSVQSIIQKYDGAMIMEDMGRQYKVKTVLYGIGERNSGTVQG